MPSVTDRLLIMYDILLQHLFSLLQQLRTVDNGWCEHHFVTE